VVAAAFIAAMASFVGWERRREATRSLVEARARSGAPLLAFCHVGARGTVRAAEGEAGTHVAGMEVTDSGTIVAEVRVDAIGVEQTVREQLEHWASQMGGSGGPNPHSKS
jgi:hypothetical protein